MSEAPVAEIPGPVVPSRPSWSALFAVGLLSRLCYVALGTLVCDHSPVPKVVYNHYAVDDAYLQGVLADLAAPSRRAVEPWYRWDAIWYAKLAKYGYYLEPRKQSTVAFLPFLPMAMRAAGASGLDPYWAGLILPNLAFAAGLALFGSLAAAETGSATEAWKASLLVMTFPYSVFFSAPYQEGIAFALISGALLAWRHRRPYLGAASLALAGLSRLFAVAVSAAVLLEGALDWMRGRRLRRGIVPMVVAGFSGFAIMVVWMYFEFGDPKASFGVQASWGRMSPGLDGALTSARELALRQVRTPGIGLMSLGLLAFAGREILDKFRTTDRPHVESSRLGWVLCTAVVAIVVASVLIPIPGRLGFAFAYLPRVASVHSPALATVGAFALGIRAWIRRGPFWGCVILVPIVQAFSSGTLMSMNRIALMAFPAAIDAAQLIRRRDTFVAVVVLQAFAEAIQVQSFVNWKFIG